MFGLSFTHLILLAIIALVVLGPEQLPEVARTIARLLNEWKRATSDIQSSLTNTLRDDLYKQNTPNVAQENPELPQEMEPHAPDTLSADEQADALARAHAEAAAHAATNLGHEGDDVELPAGQAPVSGDPERKS